MQDGCLFYLFVFMYFSFRFLVEFVKESRFIIPSIALTTGQYLSIPFIIFSAIMLFGVGKIRSREAS